MKKFSSSISLPHVRLNSSNRAAIEQLILITRDAKILTAQSLLNGAQFHGGSVCGKANFV